ncbi:hypothetical protein MJ904_16330 [Massilia sp. MB5]|uniref:CHASE sensor domain-containing protein n=1 Tax=Massilia sp. MB5 TaxID=2919578 RepID=UPI001F0E8181|nr:CHASE sensor domain-containing protein [Massilia sp. MB5]UMR28698.1 hypothetical protein MJ904_16330 [Massilia sp. MB5]
MMLNRVNAGSVRIRLILMALATTFVALLVAAGCMLLYDARSFQQTWASDLTAQAEIVAMASVPALNFNDPAAARQNLALLRVRPAIHAGAIYTARDSMFAAYAQSAQETPVFPARPGPAGYHVEDGRMTVCQPILDNGEVIGHVYLSAQYPLLERIGRYGAILGGVMLGSLLLAALVASRLQAGITRPLAAVTGVAREVRQRRDFRCACRRPAAARSPPWSMPSTICWPRWAAAPTPCRKPTARWSTRWPCARAPSTPCCRPTGARMNSWPPWRMSCAIRWRPSAPAWTSCVSMPPMARPSTRRAPSWSAN